MMKQINITTTNIVKELEGIAVNNSTDLSNLSIHINSINTFVKKLDSDFIEMDYQDLNEYRQEIHLRDEKIEFRQQYDIDIESKSEDSPFNKLSTEIVFQDNDTLAYLVIKKGSKLSYYDELYPDFLDYITEQAIRSNIMLYLFDVEYKEDIKQFVDVIKKIKKITFKEDKKILISKGLMEIESISPDINMTIEDINDTSAKNDKDRVNYADRGFLISCNEGDELFNFIKPRQGEHGRNCKGELIEIEKINLDETPEFTVDDNIEIQDSFENIKYLSTKSGYLIKEGNQYNVSNSISVDEISFKTTGTINTDLDSDISINVIKDNPLEDAVEEGMRVKVQKLSIVGSIGSGTKIEARDVDISGQSHNSSFIKCINANLGVHKGKIVAREVKVKRLEGGEIIADIAIIDNAMSGKIRAKHIEIEILGSNVTIEASEHIQIQKVKGEENKFIIDPLFDSGLNNQQKDDEEYLNKLEDEIKLLSKAVKEIAVKIKNSLEPCKKIQAAIIKNKNAKLEIPPKLIKQFKQCKIMRVRYKKLKEELEHKQNQLKNLDTDTVSILDTEIILNQPLKGFNHITYKLHHPDIDVELNTNESMNKKTFKLIKDEDEVLKIVNV